jgi:DNA-binding NtrC family response regulator
MAKKILIVDDRRFSRICSAILETVGYEAEAVTDIDELPAQKNFKDFGLIITSYPYPVYLLNKIIKKKIPKIIFSDNIDDSLMHMLNEIDNSYCMIKPLDYGKFTSLVKGVMAGTLGSQGGYSIV